MKKMSDPNKLSKVSMAVALFALALSLLALAIQVTSLVSGL